jgi:D-glycero-alpha-D-manno-heptose 1-phosphate guanylyltransferase
MKAVILAGGLGTRLRAVVSEVPKPMAEVLGKPFLAWQIEQLKKFGVVDIIISIGYLGAKIKQYFQDGKRLGTRIEYAEESHPLGTGGALKNALQYLISEEKFLVMNGDTYLTIDFADFSRFHEEKDSLITMALAKVERPSKSGFVELDKENRIVNFVEREKGVGITNAGYLIFSSEIFNRMPDEDKFSLEYDLYPKIVGTKRVFGYLTTQYFRDLGNPDDYEAIKKELGAVVCS